MAIKMYDSEPCFPASSGQSGLFCSVLSLLTVEPHSNSVFSVYLSAYCALGTRVAQILMIHPCL